MSEAENRIRWEHLALNGLRHGNHIRNFHKLSGKQRHLALQFFGMLQEQQDCPHYEYKGVDMTPITNQHKRWRCTRCEKIRVGTQ